MNPTSADDCREALVPNPDPVIVTVAPVPAGAREGETDAIAGPPAVAADSPSSGGTSCPAASAARRVPYACAGTDVGRPPAVERPDPVADDRYDALPAPVDPEPGLAPVEEVEPPVAGRERRLVLDDLHDPVHRSAPGCDGHGPVRKRPLHGGVQRDPGRGLDLPVGRPPALDRAHGPQDDPVGARGEARLVLRDHQRLRARGQQADREHHDEYARQCMSAPSEKPLCHRVHHLRSDTRSGGSGRPPAAGGCRGDSARGRMRMILLSPW